MSIAFKSLCIRLTPLPTRAWLHGWRFAWLLHRRPQDPETALLRDLLQPGDVAIHVGANGANWTWLLSQAVGPDGHVFAFGPTPTIPRRGPGRFGPCA